MTAKRSSLVVILALLSSAVYAEPVRESRDWVQVFDVGGAPTLEVSNIFGDVTVVAGPPGTIELAIESVRSAADAQSFELSKTRIPIVVEQSGDMVIARVGRDQHDWDRVPRCYRCKVEAQFTITVPVNSTIDVGTVNDGLVTVNGVRGSVSASNVNGGIRIAGLAQCRYIKSINGGVMLDYDVRPKEDCDIETINGDIAIRLPAPAALDLAVDLGNGRVRSDFDVAPRAMAATVEQRSRGGKTVYDIQQMAGLRIGSGGAMLKIKSLNGDVRISRSKNDD
ncbi:MAG: hypothetical protein AAF270_00935 [Pseudomonadota bacterium]